MANILVGKFIEPETPIGTTLWASLKVISLLDSSDIISDSRQRIMLARRIRAMCNKNLRTHMPDVVKREHGKAYGIHLGHYRIVGFFHQSYRDFIAVDYFEKKKQKNDKRMTAIYLQVDKIREDGTWQKLK